VTSLRTEILAENVRHWQGGRRDIVRKITFGSQSLGGAQALAANRSLIATAKRQAETRSN